MEFQKLSVFTVWAVVLLKLRRGRSEPQLLEIVSKTVNTDSSRRAGLAVWSSSTGWKGPDRGSPTPKGTSGLFNLAGYCARKL